mgnify:CR=1 FL=1
MLGSRSHRNFASQYQNKKEVTDAHDQEILMPKLNQRVINFIINEEGDINFNELYRIYFP